MQCVCGVRTVYGQHRLRKELPQEGIAMQVASTSFPHGLSMHQAQIGIMYLQCVMQACAGDSYRLKV